MFLSIMENYMEWMKLLDYLVEENIIVNLKDS